MKKMIKNIILVAAAAMGFTACQKEIQEEVPVNKGEVQVTFVAGSADTKTSVDTSGEEPLFSWGENETFAVLEQTSELAAATSVAYEKVDGKANITATFAANAGHPSYDYVTVYPASGYVSATGLAEATLSLPAVQTMAEDSYDPAADLMVSEVVNVKAQPTEAQMVRFTRVAAVVKMTLKNLALESGDEVEQVIFTAEGKNIAGTVTAGLADPHAFAVAAGVDNVTVNTTSSNDVYFTVLPTTLEAGDTYTITVLTSNRLYVRKGVIPAEKSLVFEAGMVTRFGVNMEGIAASEKWVLVRDASTLAEGDIVTIAASGFNYVMGKMGSYYAYASYTEVIKMGDYLYHPVTPVGTTSGDNVLQQLVLANGDKDNAFHFYNGIDFTGDSYSGYVCVPTSNNYLKVQDYPNNKSLFYIEIEDGVASVVASDSEVTYNALKYRAYNGGTSTTNRRFGCANSTSTDVYDVCIYRLAGAKGVVPTAGAVVSVPDEDEKVVIVKDGVAEGTEFEGVEFTYVGDWTIKAATDAEWLTLNYADGVLKYTAEANDSEVRYAVVTITASHEGEDDKTWTFNVVQKGAPVKATVAEFIEYAKTVDPNIEYEVTGILQTKGSGTSYSTYVVDAAGNEATFKYIDMEDDTDFYKGAVAAGDVVTIVASVANKGIGGSSAAHAVCKGYYNLKAEVENDLVSNEGGDVKITLVKSGSMEPAGDITAEVSEGTAGLEYTANADKATVTLPANDGAPRQVVVTFTDGYATTSVALVQSADPSKGNTWELVTEASSLAEFDQVIIAAKENDVAMSTTISDDRRDEVAVTKLGNYYLTPALDAQTLVLAKGSAEGTFAFYDGVNEGYLVSSSSSSSTYKLTNQTYIDANTSFTVEIADGVATIKNKEGSYSSNKIQYYKSKNYFFSGTSAREAVCLYRLVGVKGTIPVTPADVTVPTKSVVVPEEGAAEATAIDDVVFNYVGEWNISATSEAEWLTLAFDKTAGKLTYTAVANEDTAREASVTITASMDGQESLTWTFNVLQKGAPMEVSIAEFITKEKNENVTYKLTGVVTTVPSSYSYAYVIEDGNGNKANIKYLKTEEGNYVVQDDNMDVRVGDVITVTTVVTSTTKGTGGSTTYPSYFKGYYRLTATADKGLIDYEGGTATITLETSGNLVPADETIKGAMAGTYDFVTFDYTENAATATATFAANAGAPRNAEFNFTFGLAPASVTIGQQNNPDVKVGWYRVESVDDLKAGDKVIISGKSLDGTLDYSIKTWTSTSTSTTLPITVVGNYIPDVTDIQQFTLANGAEAYPGTFAIVRTDNRYLSNSSGSLKTGTSINEYSSWSIAIDSDNNGAVVLKVSKAYSQSKDTIMLTWTESSQTFAFQKSDTTGKGAIYIYKYYGEQ